MAERLPLIQIAVVRAADGPQRNIPSTTRCTLCDRIPEDHELVLRIQDYDAGPGIHETVLHKSCVQAVLDASPDDDLVDLDVFRTAALGRFAAN